MKICGIQTLTLLDFPGHVAATLFTGGCGLRCPFCHNGDLILPEDVMDTEDVMKKLQKRVGVLDGVAITGGEPTLHRDLPDLIRRIRDMGLAVKLDTNGTNPEMLRSMVNDGLLDYVAMDIKNSPDRYGYTVGLLNPPMEPIRESVEFLKEGRIPFEFRTTLIPELHDRESMEGIGAWIPGTERYFLQAYKESEFVLEPIYTEPRRDWMEAMRQVILPMIPNTQIRGID